MAAGKKITLTFIPHLIPVNSGICTTTTATLQGTAEKVEQALHAAYEDSSFIRLLGRGKSPDTKNVTRTNFIDVGWEIDERTGRLILLSAEDNLGKGAASQAIQSFNLMTGLPDTTGIATV